MCTILLQSETLPAEKRSRKDSQTEVDKLMEYDRKLSEPFTREELQKIFDRERLENTSISKYCDTSAIERYIDYTLLTDAEKEFVKNLELPPLKARYFTRKSAAEAMPGRSTAPAESRITGFRSQPLLLETRGIRTHLRLAGYRVLL